MSASESKKQKTFFWSHGGPTFMYKTSKDVPGANTPYNYVEKFGHRVKSEFKPKYIAVISAHWQPRYAGPESMKKVYVASPKNLDQVIDNDEKIPNDLIYDFYNFPKYMYEEKFESYVTKGIIDKIISFSDENVTVEKTERGIDHGVWVPSKVAKLDVYDSKEDFIPFVQVSMLPNIPNGNGEDERLNENANIVDTFKAHIQTISPLIRKINEDGGLVILSGMSVHNLSIFKKVISEQKHPEFVKRFNELLRNIIEEDKKSKDNHSALRAKILDLGKENSDNIKKLFEAHSPEIDHFLPFVIGVGSISEGEYITELFNAEEYSLGWGLYQVGS
ncbi:uncharacterized protein HGUI_00567 [Hanseniaspora guilliermondii]|uniref:Extradiol ring-cleavage dioxygenase class III enzyme subunit B domain-containing protein n=1 Tax=Hanseniaspora guilliermondii TaxID=56406 RepID=A0A1L0CUD0_9ASCO|nr:uncharacterized protein HGUI_00567 [Hanseniaspora guilliermondii]